MQNLENSGLKIAEENLMTNIKLARKSLDENREAILNGEIKPRDKFDVILDRLYSINLKQEVDVDSIKLCLKETIQELAEVINNKSYEDSEYLRELILKIDFVNKNLKYILDDPKMIVKYSDLFFGIRYHLVLKIFKQDNKQAKQNILIPNQK